jgi:hypothetical protein
MFPTQARNAWRSGEVMGVRPCRRWWGVGPEGPHGRQVQLISCPAAPTSSLVHPSLLPWLAAW